MTEQKLREKIAIDLKVNYYHRSPLEQADQILALIKEAGYVQLAEVQTLPTNDWGDTELNRGWHIAQKEMFKAGWRKVEVKDGS